MDYEKKYNDALEKARKYRDNAKAVKEYSAATRYENIFPELRESEDERNWKVVLEYIKDDSLRSWLEKQKESLGGTFSSYEMAKTFTDGQNYVMKHPEKFGLQKPAEWSEEDEKIRKQLISICDEWLSGGCSARPCLNDVRWLKNLLERHHRILIKNSKL